ncbi:tRNA (adenosine(37)-N6)-dimethylallyltransferase MiaA [Nitrosomonas sp. Nm51]|uniref:tRNA (adenosine(37)-N6)-dimethylallyltransferase MiaA n=1 Tax=Nitrosomonas sp. Nm51 TaxID=133720 RepID=UPI001C435DCE|nr:tRNA (adenosine(37)-N6)-dimethylallyltransferase MiaA [Nitrosomonas sp. Nm51]
MGPTASGKSRIALEIAGQFPVEIVSVDSAQVYRHMNIGTAKPGRDILARTPHHLIDLIDPVEQYSAAQFRRDVLNVMQDITGRGKIPLLAGGTMLYFQALLDGLSVLPEADNRLRATIESKAVISGWPALHKKLAALDIESAARIKPTDSQRIQRALEVCMLTGRPMSEILKAPRNAELPFRLVKLALLPADRGQLHQRIAQRFENMLQEGLIDEVSLLRQQFDLNPELPSMRCVGYRQTWLYLEKKINLEALRDKGIVATRQLAKRQLTWLRSIMRRYEVTALDCLADDVHHQVRVFLHAANIGDGAAQ